MKRYIRANSEAKWVNIELERDEAEIFKKYLREQGIKYEPSEAYNLIHIESYMTPEQIREADKFCDEHFN